MKIVIYETYTGYNFWKLFDNAGRQMCSMRTGCGTLHTVTYRECLKNAKRFRLKSLELYWSFKSLVFTINSHFNH